MILGRKTAENELSTLPSEISLLSGYHPNVLIDDEEEDQEGCFRGYINYTSLVRKGKKLYSNGSASAKLHRLIGCQSISGWEGDQRGGEEEGREIASGEDYRRMINMV